MNNSSSLWFYLDPLGTKQGPFSNSDMVAWREAGWFDALTLNVAPPDSDSFVPMHTVSCLMQPTREASHSQGSNPVFEPRAATEDSAASSPDPQIPSPEAEDGEDLSKVLSALNLNRENIPSSPKQKKTQGLSSAPASAASDIDDIVATPNTSLNATDHSAPKKTLPADIAAKRDLVRSAQTGRAKWQSFQATKGGRQASAAIRPHGAASCTGSLEANKSEPSSTKEEGAKPPPVSFKLNSKSSAKSKKAGSAQGSKVASSARTLPVATAPTTTSAASSQKRQLRRRVVVLDTSTWIDEADRTLTPSLLLQGLATTQVTLVLPEQVVKELDGLKEQREYGGPRPNWSGPINTGPTTHGSTASDGSHGRPLNSSQAPLSVTAQRARRVIGFLQEQMTPNRPNRNSAVSNYMGGTNELIGASLCTGVASTMKSISSGLSSLADDSDSSFVVGITDTEVATNAAALSDGSSGSMAADTKILSTAIAVANHLGQLSGVPGGLVSGKAKTPAGPYREDPVYLCTSDKNLALLAAVHGIRAGNLASLRAELADRETAWRRAYAQEAVAAAQGLSAAPI